MLPPHIIVIEEILPEVRRRMARSLYSEGMSQGKIASYLGTSQAMVSRYLKEEISSNSEISSLVERVSRELTVAVQSGETPMEITDRFCTLMEISISKGHLDNRYRTRFKREPSRARMYPLPDGGKRAEILDDLMIAVRYLVSHPIPDLIPALKVNIAYSMEGAKSDFEVASFPGRLPDRKGSILEPIPPEFGGSKHLASALISAIEGNPNIRAVISTRYGDRIKGSISILGMDHMILDRSNEDLTGLLKRSTSGDIFCMTDPGDFGIEPCLYIFGTSPLEVVSLAVEIQRKGGEDDGI
jgi:XRE family transcriptional regulator, thiamine biosynthesis regulator